MTRCLTMEQELPVDVPVAIIAAGRDHMLTMAEAGARTTLANRPVLMFRITDGVPYVVCHRDGEIIRIDAAKSRRA
jgi:hypothetical protein